MPFISTIPAAEAEGTVKEMYQRQESAWGYVPSYAMVFCHHPEVMGRWGRMLAEIRRPVDDRRFELVTFAVAIELRHSPCSLAHGKNLADIVGDQAVIALANGEKSDVFSEAEMAIVNFARLLARDAASINQQVVTDLKEIHELSDEDVFDVAAIASARCFFSKLLDALGTEADSPFKKINKSLREPLTVGRPIANDLPENLP